MKKCIVCKIEKDKSQFFRDKTRPDGLQSRCNECDRLKNRIRREGNSPAEKERNARYYEKNKEKIRERRLDWYYKNKEKFSAHQKVKTALYHGDITKLKCEKCGEERTIAHHEDYSKPLEVIWLCHRCHMRLHHGK